MQSWPSNFLRKLMGAAIGDDTFVTAHTARRVQAVSPLLEQLSSSLQDAQVGIRLLRPCASYGRVMHSMRCTPPASHQEPLQQFDSMVQAAFSSITGLHLNSAQREQASRGLCHAVLGLRSATFDSPAGFLPKDPQPLLVNNWTRLTLLLLLSWCLQSHKRRLFSTRLCGTPWPLELPSA